MPNQCARSLDPGASSRGNVSSFYGSLHDKFLRHIEGKYEMTVTVTCTNKNCPQPTRQRSRTAFAIKYVLLKEDYMTLKVVLCCCISRTSVYLFSAQNPKATATCMGKFSQKCSEGLVASAIYGSAQTKFLLTLPLQASFTTPMIRAIAAMEIAYWIRQSLWTTAAALCFLQ